MKKCPSCGITLQIKDQNQIGYIPTEKFPQEGAICVNCFKLKHYKKINNIDYKIDPQWQKTIGQTTGHIFLVTDIYRLFASLKNPAINELIAKRDITLLINKFDHLKTDSINQMHLKSKIEQYLKIKKINFLDIKFICATDDPLGFMKKYKAKKLIFVGLTSTGKSTIINNLIKKDALISSSTLNTTKSILYIPFYDKTLIDTPGIENPHDIFNILPNGLHKYMALSRPVRPKTYELIGKSSLCLGGLVRIDNFNKDKLSFTFFNSHMLKIEKLNHENLEDKWQKLLDNNTLIPKIDKYESHEYKLTGEKTSIIFCGLAICKIVGKNPMIKVTYPKGLRVDISEGGII